MAASSFIRSEFISPRAAPLRNVGVSGWIVSRMFSTPFDFVLSITGFIALIFVALPLIQFLLVDAVWTGENREACAAVTTGACWPFIQAKFGQFIYGFYPQGERWRVNIVFIAGILLLVPLLTPSAPMKRLNTLLFLVVYPLASFVLLTGGNLNLNRFVLGRLFPFEQFVAPFIESAGLRGLPGMRAVFWADFVLSAVLLTLIIASVARLVGTPFRISLKVLVSAFFFLGLVIVPVDADFGLSWIETREWGGLLVTLVVAVSGIVASLPLGIMLALGRRSEMRLVRWTSIAFIEFWRGVPLITVLFFATYMLPLFLPGGASIERLVRALIGVALFSGAYMAEVVRGGLQAVPRQQYESAAAIGLGYWKTMGLVVLPQALKHVIPGIVNNFIGLFKDTTLVQIVAIFDLLGQVRSAFSDPNWATPTTLYTGFAFAGIIYFAFCFGMSRYSQFLERRTGGSALRTEMERR